MPSLTNLNCVAFYLNVAHVYTISSGTPAWTSCHLAVGGTDRRSRQEVCALNSRVCCLWAPAPFADYFSSGFVSRDDSSTPAALNSFFNLVPSHTSMEGDKNKLLDKTSEDLPKRIHQHPTSDKSRRCTLSLFTHKQHTTQHEPKLAPKSWGQHEKPPSKPVAALGTIPF